MAVKVNGDPGTSGFGVKVQLETKFRAAPPFRVLKMLLVSTPGPLRFRSLWMITPGLTRTSLKKVIGLAALAPKTSNRILKSSELPLCTGAATKTWPRRTVPATWSIVEARVRTKAPVGRPVPPQNKPDWSIRTAFRTVGSYWTLISKPLMVVVLLREATTSIVKPPPAPAATTAVGLSDTIGCRVGGVSVSAKYVAWQLLFGVPS
jgi:hypothetical protein